MTAMRTAERWFRDNQLVTTGRCVGRVCGFVAVEAHDPRYDQLLITPVLPNRPWTGALVFECRALGLTPGGADGAETDDA